MEIWSLIGIFLVLFVFYRFIGGIGSSIPVLELLLLISGLQWIVGPVIEYNAPGNYARYRMYVEEMVYMQYVVPAYGLFLAGVLLPMAKYTKTFIPIEYFSTYSKLGFTLFVVGILADVLGSFVPGSLVFFFYLLSNFKFVGAIILFFSKDSVFKNIFYLLILYLFYNSIQKALFHDFILWGMFFYLFWALKYKPSIRKILTTFLLGVFFLITIQTVKEAYRKQVWSGYAGNKTELFIGLILDSVFINGLFDELAEEETNSKTNVRLNQGWIISAVMANIPQNQKYLEGETVSDAVISSVFPRFLMSDKEIAGGKKNFERFTGLTLGTNTSMGISIVGEAYGNYGVYFGAYFMFFWGLFLAFIWRRLNSFFLDNMIYVCFVPLIFLQVIKAETELVVVLNYLFKSLIVVFLFIYFYGRYSYSKYIT